MLNRILLLALLYLSLDTQAQTLVKDIYPSSGNSSPFFMGSVNGKILFAANTPQEGRELWASDGTSQGTQLLQDFIPGVSGGLMFNSFYVSDTLVYFFAKRTSTTSPVSLFATNGTSNGTVWLCDIADNAPPEFSGINGKFIFTIRQPNGRELWVSNGTPSGTRRLKDINTGTNGAEPFNLTPCQDKLFFFADDNEHGQELWLTDGTEAGTRLVKDIFPGTVSSTFTSSQMPGMIAFNNKVYFCAIEDLKIGFELFVSDGTDTGTRLVKDIYPGDYHHSTPYVLSSCDKFLIMYVTNTSGQTSLWRSDGTEAGTFPIRNDSTGNMIKNTSGKFLNLGNKLIFQYTTQQFGSEFWVSDGSMEGTMILIDAVPGAGTGTDGTIFKYKDQFIFKAVNPLFGTELWISDGTQDNTGIFMDIVPGTTGSGLNSLLLVKNTLYCTLLINANIGTELYKIELDGISSSLELSYIFSQSTYPNPCKSGQVLSAPRSYKIIGLYNSTGQAIYLDTISETSFQLPENIVSGTYFLFLSDGYSIKREKIVVLN